MTIKPAWTTVLTANSFVQIIFAFLACGAVMAMMIVEMALMNPLLVHQDIANRVSIEPSLKLANKAKTYFASIEFHKMWSSFVI